MQLDVRHDSASTDAVLLRSGEGEPLSLTTATLVLEATGGEADGIFLPESAIEPGFPGPPLHVHRKLHDMFFALEGTVTFRVGEATLEAGPGTFVLPPPGVAHTFRNDGSEPARFLDFDTPAGWEGSMRDLAAAFAGGTAPTAGETGAIASRYDFQVVG